MTRFSTKLTLVLLAVAIIPTVLVSTILVNINLTALKTTSRETYIAAADRLQDKLLDRVQSASVLLSAASAIFSNRQLSEQTALVTVRELLAARGAGEQTSGRGRGRDLGLGVYDIHNERVDVLGKGNFPTILPTSSETITLSSNTASNLPSILVSIPWLDNGTRIGNLVSTIDNDELCAVVERVSTQMFTGDRARVLLLDSTLRIIAAADRNRVKSGETLRGKGMFATQQAIMQYVGMVVEYVDSTSTVVKTDSPEPMLGIALALPLLHCIVLVEEPQSKAYYSIEQMRTNAAWWTLASALIAVAASIVLAWQIAKPVQELSTAAAELSRQNFSHRLPDGRRDEFGMLYAAHNRTSEELGKYTALNVSRILAERNKLEAVVRSANDGILLLDDVGKILLVNPVFAGWFGIDAGSEGLLLHDIRVSNANAEHIASELEAFATTNTNGEMDNRPTEFRLKNDGELRELILRGTFTTVRQHETREHLASLLLLRNVTREVETDRMKTELVAVVAHELRSPLNSINGLAELISEGVLPPNDTAEFGRTIAAQSRKLAGIITKFLDLNRMESGKTDIRRIPVRVDEIVRSVLAVNAPLAHKKSITVQTTIPPVIPPVLGDPDFIGQAVLNLLSNAVKYSLSNTEIHISVVVKASELQVMVRDSGYGISESSQQHLFTKFFRAPDDPRVQNDTGTGLGLAFVKEIAEQHGGTVGVESRLNAGSTFWFTIPI
jgi:two-component system, NtrC family, sensor histidine kinase KinB